MADTWATLLEPFNKGQQLPEKARTEPHIPQKEAEPMTLAKLWQYVPFLAVQGELQPSSVSTRPSFFRVVHYDSESVREATL